MAILNLIFGFALGVYLEASKPAWYVKIRSKLGFK